MNKVILVALASVVLPACFDTTVVDGLPCDNNRQCGSGHICGPAPLDRGDFPDEPQVCHPSTDASTFASCPAELTGLGDAPCRVIEDESRIEYCFEDGRTLLHHAPCDCADVTPTCTEQDNKHYRCDCATVPNDVRVCRDDQLDDGLGLIDCAAECRAKGMQELDLADSCANVNPDVLAYLEQQQLSATDRDELVSRVGCVCRAPPVGMGGTGCESAGGPVFFVNAMIALTCMDPDGTVSHGGSTCGENTVTDAEGNEFELPFCRP